MQFGFMPGGGTTDAIFILRQVYGKYLGKHKDLYFGFIDLEKPFEHDQKESIVAGFEENWG